MAVSAALLLAILGLTAVRASAEDIRFFRIGTGAISGSLFAVGSAIANIISNPPGSRPCDRGGSCGVPNLVAVAQSTEGSIANVRLLGDGMLESALAQADIVYWAYHGTGPFQGEAPIEDLRAVANLFAQQVHIVTRRDGGVFRVSDLVGKRISLGPEGSGTPVNARAILTAYGIGEEDFSPLFLTPGEASDSLEAGEIDAFVVVGGVPVDAVTDLAERLPIMLLPIDGPERDEITSFYPFLVADSIQAGSYFNVGHAQTVSLGTQLLMSGRTDEALAHAVCRALWQERNQILLAESHVLAGKIRLETARERVAIPLHPGAERCYEEMAEEAPSED
jgi:TRAP transporter TAXI family solute receptor